MKILYFSTMLLHPEFKQSTRQFWRQMEMFHVFLDHPELGVSVSYETDLIDRLQIYNDYCALDLPEKPSVMFQAGIIDGYPLNQVEEILGRFSFETGDEAYIATLGIFPG